MELGIDGLGYATEIGAGASAIVYKARQVDLDREVAVKVLSVTDDAFVRRFKREAKTLGKLSQNPGIVTVYDTGVNGAGHPYLILELCDSSLLDQVKASGLFKPREACMAMAEVAIAVGDAHENGVVHRDIKPGNVLVSPTGRYMVTDFGISTVTGATMGQTNSVGFTAGYVAPETLTGEEAGPPADVYALGATLFHMVAGKAPFVDPEKSSNLLALAQRVINDPVPDLRGDGVDDDVCRVIEATMAKDPADRPTAVQMAAYLQTIVDGQSPVIEAASAETNGASVSDETQAIPAAGAVAGASAETMATDLTVTPSDPSPAAEGNDALVNATSVVEHALPSNPAPSNPAPANPVPSTPGPPATPNPPVASAGLFESAADATSIQAANGDASRHQDILSNTPGVGGPASVAGEDRRYQFTQDDRRGLGPLLVGAVVGLLVLVAFAGFLIFRSQDQTSDIAGEDDGGNSEVIAGPGAEPTENESSDQGLNGNTGSLVDGEEGSTTTTDRTTTIPVLRVQVPNVVGSTATAAAAELRDSGFAVNRVDEESATVAVGTVIRQDPATGRAESGAVITIFVSTEKPKETIDIPILVGLSETEAKAKLVADGLVAETTTAASATVAKGNVISSSPEVGTTVTVGSTVALVISDGPSVPLCADLIGLTEAAATAQLQAGSLTVTSSTAASETVPIGQVISCDQTATTATLVVSSGAADPCTGVAGTTVTAATTKLEAAGLTVVTEEVAGSTVASGNVISCTIVGTTATLRWSNPVLPTTCASAVGTLAATATTALEAQGLTVVSTPAPSATVAEGTVLTCTVSGSTATMTVSSGAAKVTVPNMLGRTEAAAKTALTGVGLSAGTTTSVASSLPAGQVVASTPAFGASVDPGTIVSLQISTGPALVAVPGVVGLAETTAVNRITARGLTPAVLSAPVAEGSADVGKVISQSVAGNTMVAPGTSVTITVGVATPEP